MVGDKPRTPPYSVHQVYGEVTAKICRTLFCKSVDYTKQDRAVFSKIWGGFARENIQVHAPHPCKMYDP